MMNLENRMWFGTQHHSEYITPPLAGADMSASGWGVDGSFLSGGGFSRQSQDTHRQYIFEWGGSSSREFAALMQKFRSGYYSDKPSDLMYFIDPLIYDINILPARWASPYLSMQADGEGFSIFGTGERSLRTDATPRDFPRLMARVFPRFTLTQFDSMTSPQPGVLWVPIPEGKTLYLRSRWSFTGTGTAGLAFRPLEISGAWGSAGIVAGNFSSETAVTGARGVLLAFVGPSMGRLSLMYNMARIGDSTPESPDLFNLPPGLGHSGCQFVGTPSWIANSGVHGGQIGFGTTLKEVGDWQV